MSNLADRPAPFLNADGIDLWDAAPRAATEPRLREAAETALLAALADMTAAYHQERGHEGRWSKCQQHRCQNARLTGEGRGPFIALLSAGDKAEAPPYSEIVDLAAPTGRTDWPETSE